MDDDRFPTVLTLTGISVSDADLNVDVIKCQITCQLGRFTLNPQAVSQLDFTSTQYCLTGIQNLKCTGDSADEGDAVFLGTPTAVSKALEDMTYETPVDQTEDTCFITIYDGAGDNCMPEELLDERREDTDGSSSIYDSTCFVASVNFTITALEFAFEASSSADGCDSVTGFCILWYYWIMIVVALFCCLVSLCLAIQKKWGQHIQVLIGMAAYDSDEEEEEDTELAEGEESAEAE